MTLRVRASADRVLIEVQDECGGLPGEVEDKDLVPSFEQRGADRPAWALGSRSAAGVPKLTVGGSTRATCSVRDVSLPWTCRGLQFRRSRLSKPDAAGERPSRPLSPMPGYKACHVPRIYSIHYAAV